MSPKTKRYRALVAMSYPSDPAIVAALQAHKPVPQTYDVTEVEPGQIAEGLPECSVPWLLQDGRIEEVKAT